MKFKGLLFDLDGTLLDTSDLIINSFQHAFDFHYGRKIDVDKVYSYFGKPLRPAMEELGPDKVEELLRTYREYNLLHHDQLAAVFPGVKDVIGQLYQAGISLAVVTSKTHKTALRGLALFGLDQYIPLIVGCEQCTNHKPHPEPVQLALQQLGLAPEECLLVGDSPFDLISARQAGVKTAAVRWTRLPWDVLLAEKPDFVLNDMYDLLTICQL